jgi:hypothetical protein
MMSVLLSMKRGRTYGAMLAVGTLLTLQYVTMNVGDEGVGVSNVVVNVRDDGLGVHDIVMDVGNESVCVGNESVRVCNIAANMRNIRLCVDRKFGLGAD